MRCTKCGADNRKGRRFCAQCGVAMAARCARCGAPNEPGEKFCGDCGNPLTASSSSAPSTVTAGAAIRVAPESSSQEALDGERKTVTALFADIKGSTELEQDLDPEEARTIVDPALKLMIDAVRRYDGYVVQSNRRRHLRDLRRARRARRPSAASAACCASYAGGAEEIFGEIARDRQRADGSARRREHRRGRSALDRDRRRPHRVHANRAHRPISPRGYRRLRRPARSPSVRIRTSSCEGYFELKPLGPTKVKGVSEPVNVYEVTDSGRCAPAFNALRDAGLTKFVGREREMEAMQAAAERRKSGRGQIVAAMAEAGAGKSRLFFEFKARIESGWKVLEAFSVSHGKAAAFLPVIDLLWSYFEISSEDDERKRREKINGKILTLDRSLEDALPYLFGLLGSERREQSDRGDRGAESQAAHARRDQADYLARERSTSR